MSSAVYTLRNNIKLPYRSIQNGNMKKTKFRILMYGGHYVDTNRLTGDGGYITDTPYLYPENHTKEDIIKTHKEVAAYTGFNENHLKNLEHNLKDCVLHDIEININS